MRRVNKELKRYWSGKLATPPPYPFGTEFNLSGRESVHHSRTLSRLQNCAGIALILGLLTILGSVWGDPRYSSILGILDIEGLQNALPSICDFISNII